MFFFFSSVGIVSRGSLSRHHRRRTCDHCWWMDRRKRCQSTFGSLSVVPGDQVDFHVFSVFLQIALRDLHGGAKAPSHSSGLGLNLANPNQAKQEVVFGKSSTANQKASPTSPQHSSPQKSSNNGGTNTVTHQPTPVTSSMQRCSISSLFLSLRSSSKWTTNFLRNWSKKCVEWKLLLKDTNDVSKLWKNVCLNTKHQSMISTIKFLRFLHLFIFQIFTVLIILAEHRAFFLFFFFFFSVNQ